MTDPVPPFLSPLLHESVPQDTLGGRSALKFVGLLIGFGLAVLLSPMAFIRGMGGDGQRLTAVQSPAVEMALEPLAQAKVRHNFQPPSAQHFVQPARVQRSTQPTGARNFMQPSASWQLAPVSQLARSQQLQAYKCERSELRPKMLFLGDSNTEEAMQIPTAGGGGEAYSSDDEAPDEFGWAVRVKAKVGTRRADVVQRGYDGFNTRKALVMLPAILKDFKEPFLFATVAFGSNDMADPVDPDVHVPVEEYEANMRKLLQTIKASPGAEHLVVWSPPPVDNERWPTRRNESVLLYTEAGRRAAEAEGAAFVDSYALFKDVWGTSTRDGLHLNQNGGKILANAIIKALPQDILCENKGIPMDFPLFRDVSNSDVASSLTADALAKLSYPVKPQTFG